MLLCTRYRIFADFFLCIYQKTRVLDEILSVQMSILSDTSANSTLNRLATMWMQATPKVWPVSLLYCVISLSFVINVWTFCQLKGNIKVIKVIIFISYLRNVYKFLNKEYQHRATQIFMFDSWTAYWIFFFFFFWQNEIAWFLDNFRIITVNDNMFSAENAC